MKLLLTATLMLFVSLGALNARQSVNRAKQLDNMGGHGSAHKIGTYVSDAYEGSDYVNETFPQQPSFTAAIGFGNPVGTDTITNLMISGARTYEYYLVGTQTILAYTFDAQGIDIALDQTDTEGSEITGGVDGRGACVFEVGEDTFFVRGKVKVADVSGSQFAVGYRKVAAYAADDEDYTDVAALVAIGVNVFTREILNNASTVDTNTTVDVADTVVYEFEVVVKEDGSVFYEIDDVKVTTNPSGFKLDQGDSIFPFVRHVHSSDLAGTVELDEYECGRYFD